MERIEAEVRRELRRFGPPGGLPAILEIWLGAVGETIARNAWPARVARDGTLHVAVSSSTWAFELAQLGPTILERLRERLDDAAPGALRFAPGPLPERATVPERKEASGTVLEPGPAEAAQATELAAEVGDAELRERIARAAALSLARGASGRSV